MNALGRFVDTALDWTVVPGYSKIGYAVRERTSPPGELRLAGRSVVVTGATSGIGEAACADLARAGARVHLLVRDLERGKEALERTAERSGSEELDLHRCDLSNLASVRAFAGAFERSGESLDVLVNNAGVLPPQRTETDEGVELTFATNVLGPFALTALLLPALRRAAPARVVNVSSGGMYTAKLDLEDLQLTRQEFSGNRFYAHTKRAEVVLSEEWARRLAPERIAVFSMHPGWVATPGIKDALPGFDRLLGPILRDPAAGAETIVWLAGSPRLPETGDGFWHDRRERPKHRVPWTREAPGDGARLFEECEQLAGLEIGD